MTDTELSNLNSKARAFFSRWVPRWKIAGMDMYGRRVTLSMSPSGIATALYHNPITGRVEIWGIDLGVWRKKHQITPKLLRT